MSGTSCIFTLTSKVQYFRRFLVSIKDRIRKELCNLDVEITLKVTKKINTLFSDFLLYRQELIA
jgi:uncharacterized protein (DUF927 family)